MSAVTKKDRSRYPKPVRDRLQIRKVTAFISK